MLDPEIIFTIPSFVVPFFCCRSMFVKKTEQETFERSTLNNATRQKDYFVSAIEYNNSFSVTRKYEIGEPMPENHWSAMLPKGMNDGAVMVDGFAALQRASGKQLGNLDQTNRLEFSGGGGTMEYTLTHHAVEQHVSMMGEPTFEEDLKRGTWEHKNSNGEFNFDGEVTFDAEIFKVAVDFDILAEGMI